MAEEQVEENRSSDEESNDEQNGRESNGSGLGKVAVFAAASGATAATAIAARKALSNRSSSSSGDDDEEGGKGKSGGSRLRNGASKTSKGSASLVGAAVTSGWDVAKDTVLPIVEEAATKAGAYVAESTPELVRDVVVPRFIAGFESARDERSGDSDDD